ncbi:MAG TPA: hypothetical protein VK625_21485 [Flavitalea sp.]|nr:hypothetical protein [Flavitalea sp.]
MKNQDPVVSINTPGSNMLPYLKLCHASVMDQGITVEHIVIDGGSTHSARECLPNDAGILSENTRNHPGTNFFIQLMADSNS